MSDWTKGIKRGKIPLPSPPLKNKMDTGSKVGKDKIPLRSPPLKIQLDTAGSKDIRWAKTRSHFPPLP